jgi:hypothetical protein
MDKTLCAKKFQNLINSDYGAINDCLTFFSEKLTSGEDVYEDLLNGHCLTLVEKKTSYYTKTYDPEPIIENFKSTFGESHNIYKKILDFANTDKIPNCCNCVSVTLYINNFDNVNFLGVFIFTIEQSVLNVKKYLPDWIFRLYIDPSVFNFLHSISHNEEHSDKYQLYLQTLKNIASQPNCEIYLSLCSSYYLGEKQSGKRRSGRFRGFYELDVNINASREADGVIDVTDCHNLKMLESLPVASYFYIFGSGPGQEYYSRIYGSKSNIFFSLSAGLIAMKLKIKSTFYSSCVQRVIANVEKALGNDFKAFDEYLLIELFKDFICERVYTNELTELFGILTETTTDSPSRIVLSYELINKETSNALEKSTGNIFSNALMTPENFVGCSYCLDTNFFEYINNIFKIKNVDDDILSYFLLNMVHLFFSSVIGKNIIGDVSRSSNKFICNGLYMSVLNLCNPCPDDNFFSIKEVSETGSKKYLIYNFFVELCKYLRDDPSKINKASMVGGNNVYYKKYLKYKKKYLGIKFK